MTNTERRYHYEVTKTACGDYTTPNGKPEIIYAGPSEGDAMEAAQEAADDSEYMVRISVSRKMVRAR